MKPHLQLIQDIRRAKKDGNYPLKIRITFNRKQKYYPTSIDLTEDEWKSVQGDKTPKNLKESKLKINGVLAKARVICDDLKTFSFPSFEKTFYQVRSKGNLVNMYEDYIGELTKEERIATAKNYTCSLNSLLNFKSKINFDDITVEFLKRYEKWMLQEQNSITTVGIYLRPLRAIYKKAIAEGLINLEHYPFGTNRYEIPSGVNIKKALTINDVGKIYNYQTKLNSMMDRAKDFWLLTYFCNGINMKDILLLQNKNIEGDFITFIRSKTERTTRRNQKKISIYLIDDVKQIIQKWRNIGNKPEDFLFPILAKEMDAATKYMKIQQFTKSVNKYIDRIAKDIGIERDVRTYTARHTFSTVLKRSGASIEYISEALGHSNKKTTENYLDSFEKETQKEFANKLTSFKNTSTVK
ncbi:MAG: site-specific integrase [Flavipsychrobacter sp.]|jgi:integrase|nr:site-specific integrase [Flavipsychrobacter sp.]